MERLIDVSILNKSGLQVIRKATGEALQSGTNVVDTGHLAIAALEDDLMRKRYGISLDLRFARSVLYDMAGYSPEDMVEVNGFFFSTTVPEVLDHAQLLLPKTGPKLVGRGAILRAMTCDDMPSLGSALLKRLSIEID